MALSRSDFSFTVPPDLIAQTPANPRDSSKLLQLSRATGKISHHFFRELPTLLQKGDVLVRNNSKVIPARVFGKKTTGGAVEVLLNKQLKTTPEKSTWECLTRPGLKPGQVLQFTDKLTAVCTGYGSDSYTRTLEFSLGGIDFIAALHTVGQMPLPPYITSDLPEDQRKIRYQTTYAAEPGSAAAPTAGLHFTPELDAQLADEGITIADVTLHVGLGTFLPVSSDTVAEHHMHSELLSLSEETATLLNAAKADGRRIIAVGTTTVRTLESCIDENGYLKSQKKETDIFIYPPYSYRFVDGIITNFHLPESTLLMLVSAFVSEPNTNRTFSTFAECPVGQAYQVALAHRYRFFSFGDAMLIL